MNPPIDTYTIKYSRRKTVGLYVSAKGLEVRAPHGTSEARIQTFVDSKRLWIARHLKQAALKQAQIPEVKLNSPVPILGEALTLQLNISDKPMRHAKVSVSDDALTFTLPRASWLRYQAKHASQQTALEDKAVEQQFVTALLTELVSDYLKQLGSEVITQRVEYYGQISGLGQKVSEIRFRKTKTKWGHCSTQGQLQFNWLLAAAPIEIIDYVVCHELSHLVEMNHSNRFWRQVERLYPNYQAARMWLKQNGHLLAFL